MNAIFRFDFRHFRGDLFGGLTAGIVALPLALAFGVSSGLGPSAGLYGAIFVSFFAALFGGTPTQISGPTAPMTAVSMVFIAEMLANFDGNVARALPTILSVFLLPGLIQILLGFIGLGKYIRYIPYPVVSGFMTAIGVIILVTQIVPSVGYYAKEDSNFVQQFKPQAEEVILENLLKEEVFIKHLEGPLFFGSTAKFTETAKQIPYTASTLVIRLDKVPYIDQSGLYALEAIIIDLVKKEKAVLLVGIDQQPKYMMERVDIIPDLIPEEQIFDTFEDCLSWIITNVKDEF